MASVGIDIVDNQRIEKLLTENFINKFLAEEEMEEFRTINTDDRKTEFVAGRIAAKEAVLKCLKNVNICTMRQIIIRKDEFGAPFATFNNLEIPISISHEKLYSVAVALCL